VKYLLEFLLLSAVLATPTRGQAPLEIPLSSEPHHHLVLHNRYVNVYHVEVPPGDAVLLHRHDNDAISIMLDDSQVTVHAPGRPDAHQDLTTSQVRLQPKGYAHSTLIEGDKAYRNVTVELLLPQKAERNLCAAVMAGQPLRCPAAQAAQAGPGWPGRPQFETDRTEVSLATVQPHQELNLPHTTGNLLAIAVDEVESGVGRSREGLLHQGDFLWIGEGGARRLKNTGAKVARVVVFKFKD
jgi:quercetin dioxygenase-like cupin family protein